MVNESVISLAGLQGINVYWSRFNLLKKIFPEKFTLFGIYSNVKPDDLNCGDIGDLYAWNIKGWKFYEETYINKSIIPVSRESSYRICDSQFKLITLPAQYFHPSLELCSRVGGEMFYEENIFQELVDLEGSRFGSPTSFWIPYSDQKDENVWRNVYSDERLTSTGDRFWARGQPNGGKTQNYLEWSPDKEGVWDITDKADVFRNGQIILKE